MAHAARLPYGAAMPALCILSPDPAHPEYAAMWPAQRAILDAALATAGIVPDYAPWTGNAALAGFDLVLPLLAWGYHDAPAAWLAQIDRWEGVGVRLANPAAVLRWNHEKTYLPALEARGAPVVPSVFAARAGPGLLEAARARFGEGPLVAKPSISAGAHGVVVLQPGEALPAGALGRPMLVQPLLPAIAAEGEYSLFWFGGAFSHAILKIPRAGDFRVQVQHGGREIPATPPAAAMAAAATVLALIDEPLLYARVDLVGDGAGYVLMELELIEPQLFLEHAADGGAAFARAIRAHTA